MTLGKIDCRSLTLSIMAASLMLGCSVKSGSSTSNSGAASSTSSQSKDSTSSAKDSKGSQTISAEGSSTVYPICQAFAVEFEKTSHHKVSVVKSGTGGGYKAFVIRQADIWNASRPIEQKEIDELKSKGIDWFGLTIAVDGIVVAVNNKNTWCSNLTCAQLKQIWEPDSKVEKWSDLDPSWPAEQILLYGADTDSGTFEYFTEVINGKKKATNIKYTPSADDNILVQGIAGNQYALGYIPFGYYIENTDKLTALGVSPTKDSAETAAPFVEPTVETILGGEYAPLSRPLFMYVSKNALWERPELADFLKYAVSPEAQPLIKLRGFVPNTEEVRQKSAKQLEDALAEKPESNKS